MTCPALGRAAPFPRLGWACLRARPKVCPTSFVKALISTASRCPWQVAAHSHWVDVRARGLPTSGHCPVRASAVCSCFFPRSLQLSTTEGTNPSASVGFLAAGGCPSIPSAVRTPFHTGHKHNLSSGNPASLNLTPRPTLLSAGAQGLVNPSERPPRSVPVESAAVRYRSSRPQPHPRSRRAFDSDTFASPVRTLLRRRGRRCRKTRRTWEVPRQNWGLFKVNYGLFPTQAWRLITVSPLDAQAVSMACGWCFSV